MRGIAITDYQKQVKTKEQLDEKSRLYSNKDFRKRRKAAKIAKKTRVANKRKKEGGK